MTGTPSSAAVSSAYKKAMDDLTESTFAHEPVWPPGGNRFIHDVFYKDDINFVFDRLLDASPKQNAGSEKKAIFEKMAP